MEDISIDGATAAARAEAAKASPRPATAWREAGGLEDAIASADEAPISIRETGERQLESDALVATGDALSAMDREDEAARCFHDAIDVAQDLTLTAHLTKKKAGNQGFRPV